MTPVTFIWESIPQPVPIRSAPQYTVISFCNCVILIFDKKVSCSTLFPELDSENQQIYIQRALYALRAYNAGYLSLRKEE